MRLRYRLVRHPLMLGFVVVFWAAPAMTTGHLLFAIGATAYILIVLVALRQQERDPVSGLGSRYRGYRRDVPMLIPVPRRHRSETVARQ